jgi:phage gpG-like protein
MNDVVAQFQSLAQHFRGISAASYAAVRREMQGIGVALVGYIRREKLSGQVLQSRSGMLKRSITAVTTEAGQVVSTEVGVFPASRVPYARIQEYGGVVRIPPYEGKIMRFHAKSGDLVFTRSRAAYTVTLPERSYVRSSLTDMSAEIVARLQAAAIAGATK